LAPQPDHPHQQDVSTRQLDQDATSFVDSEEFDDLMNLVDLSGPHQQQQQQQRQRRHSKSSSMQRPTSSGGSGGVPGALAGQQQQQQHPHASTHPMTSGAPAAAALNISTDLPAGQQQQQRLPQQQQLLQQLNQEGSGGVHSSSADASGTAAGGGQAAPRAGPLMPPSTSLASGMLPLPTTLPLPTSLGAPRESQLQPPELLPLPQCMPGMVAPPPPQQTSQGGELPPQADRDPTAAATAAASAAAAGAGPPGLLLGVTSRADLVRVTNSCLHKLLDMRLAVLMVAEQGSPWEGLRAYLSTQHQQAEAATAAAAAAAGSLPVTAAAVLSILGQFVQLLGEGLAGQGLGPQAERLFVLGAMNQLQQVLSGLQRTAAAAAGDAGADARACVGQWVAAGLGLSPQTAISPVVSRLVAML
jgi:hypothetical protein